MARKWTKDEEILAFALYCKTPFGKIHSRNDEIIQLANALERTPASVSMKLCNFARFDERLQARGVAGLSNGSHLDEEIWNEFSKNLELLEEKRNQILLKFHLPEKADEHKLDLPIGDTVKVNVNARTNPQNGLCLNALHDRAFDRGLITITTDYRIVVSKQIQDFYNIAVVQDYFGKYDGKKIELPEKFLPARQFIEYHNEYIFERLD